ncbi:MAG: hypothetical protein FJ363_04065 [Gemmatimonadetes bacterium]|nr:hypothetical protein [Gemmatimonadota bacterium]
MPPIARNILAVLCGLVLGSVVNMGLITISGRVIPPPAGVDVTTMEGLKAALPLFEPRHFLFPFLAHALGTLVGALIAAALAASRHATFAFVVGACFLVGGVANVMMLPSPAWFNAVDLVFAYLPMAWVGARIAGRVRGR